VLTGSCQSYPMLLVDWQLSSWYKGPRPLVHVVGDRDMAQGQQLVIEQEGEGEGTEEGKLLKFLKEKRGTLLKSALEATSLGLKTKSGLRPNSRKYRGFIYRKNPVLRIES